MKHVVFALCALPVAAMAQAPRPDVTSALMASVEAGVICAPETTGTQEAPGTVAGTTHLIAEEPPFIAITRRVPAVLGIGFGIKSRSVDIVGLNGVTMTVTHPPMGDAAATVQTFETVIRGTDPSLTFYQFDFDYELLPGIWQMQASIGDEVLYRTTFEVLPPEMVPELAEVCGFEELLS
ncbi:MAG: DUF3859 domain-containing protein [Pseudomonadota bacterium]